MTLSDDQFNKAFEIFQEFGLRRRIPIYQRWQQAFPEAGLDDMCDWEKEFKDIEGFAYGTAEKVRDDGLDEPSAMHQIALRFPQLSADRVLTTYNQARYFAMR
jgi:hypothetical protein